MSSTDIILHPHTQMIVERMTQNLPHGLIIDGPSGVGVVHLAKMIAKRVGSPQLIILPKKKIKNEWVVDPTDGSIIIDDIRELYERSRTMQTQKNVYIIDTGEKSMTISAQNAFLKLLEEPRDGLYFIIATHHRDQLLPTIISRTQTISALPITDEQTASLLQSLNISDPTKRARMAFVGKGKPALLHRLAVDNELYDTRVAIMQDAKTMITGSIYDKILIANKYKDSRPDSLILIDDINHQLRVVSKKQSDPKIIATIGKFLAIRDRIASGGNIRLQLSTGVL